MQQISTCFSLGLALFGRQGRSCRKLDCELAANGSLYAILTARRALEAQDSHVCDSTFAAYRSLHNLGELVHSPEQKYVLTVWSHGYCEVQANPAWHTLAFLGTKRFLTRSRRWPNKKKNIHL